MATLKELRVADPVLTNLAIGYHNAEHVGETIMPVVEIDKEAGKIPKFGREAFRKRSTIRQPRASSNRITPEALGSLDVNLDEHDLEYPTDYREQHEAAFDARAYALSVVQDSMSLTREMQIAELALDDTNYAASNKIALTGTSQFSDPNADVFGIFDDAKMAVKRAIGRDPNSGIIPADVFKVLKTHPQLVDKIKYVQKGVLTLPLLAELLDIPYLAIGAATWADAGNNLFDIWSKHIPLAYVPAKDPNRKRNIYEPSYGYSIRRKGSLIADSYSENGGKVELVRCTDIIRPYLLGADAGFLIKNAIA
jgi:hypothetical protein